MNTPNIESVLRELGFLTMSPTKLFGVTTEFKVINHEKRQGPDCWVSCKPSLLQTHQDHMELMEFINDLSEEEIQSPINLEEEIQSPINHYGSPDRMAQELKNVTTPMTFAEKNQERSPTTDVKRQIKSVYGDSNEKTNSKQIDYSKRTSRKSRKTSRLLNFDD